MHTLSRQPLETKRSKEEESDALGNAIFDIIACAPTYHFNIQWKCIFFSKNFETVFVSESDTKKYCRM
uniref:PAS domain-containing protein n=1 Tax=Caenorhabditis tropicalis TaxID=1561998 RepID=A0A1I7UKC9_9PELO